ncbi:MAG: hypothetical protein KBE16_06730 [Alphaproteobacteria bacterium]|jgi:hypothetical protein|nr:hypothetical protein [Alphaproteobacteria bacterium]MBP9876963.1 hypothetical protein [Alphaproteobacteria bacterium]
MSHIAPATNTDPNGLTFLSGHTYTRITLYLPFQEMLDYRLIRKMTEEEASSFGLVLRKRAVFHVRSFEDISNDNRLAPFNNLQYFYLDLSHLPKIDFPFIHQFYEKENQSKCQSVVKLNFDNRSIVTKHLFDFLGRFPEMKKLRLANYPSTCVRFIISHLVEPYFKNTFISLRELDLSAHHSTFPSVNTGALASEDLVRAALSFTLGACKFLRVLNLTGYNQLRGMLDDVAQESRLPTSTFAITNTLRNLRSLNLSQTPIDLPQFEMIMRTCNSLEVLILEGCDNLEVSIEKNELFWYEVKSKLGRLKELNLNNTRLLKASFNNYMIKNCTSLERLSLQGYRDIIFRSQDVDDLRYCFRHLTYIDLRQTGIDEASLQILKDVAPKLEQILL